MEIAANYSGLQKHLKSYLVSNQKLVEGFMGRGFILQLWFGINQNKLNIICILSCKAERAINCMFAKYIFVCGLVKLLMQIEPKK